MSIIESSMASQVLDMSPMGVILTDTDNRIGWINKTMQGFLSTEHSALIGVDFDTLEQAYGQSLGDDTPLWRVTSRSTGQEHWLLLVNKEVSTGITAWYFSDCSELMNLRIENQQLNDQLENTATNDPVTGILNRRALMRSLEPQVSRSRRYENPLSVIVLEIEQYTASNQAVTPVAEQVLRGVGFYLRDQLRWVDLVGRTKEFEFTLVLPETRLADAQAIAAKIGERMDDLSLPDIPDITVKIDAKLGIAEWQKGNDTQRLLDRAKDAMEPMAKTA